MAANHKNCLNCAYEPIWSRVKHHGSFVGICKWEPNDTKIASGYKLYPKLIYKILPPIKCPYWEQKNKDV